MIEMLDHYKELIGIVLGFVTTIGTIWWKIAAAFTKTQIDIKNLYKHFNSIATVTGNLSTSVTELSTKLQEREKDIMRLEGAIEVERKDMITVITNLQQTTSSLNALWRTLDNLFPEAIPKRASDRL